MNYKNRLILVGFVALALIAVGCSSDPTEPKTIAQQHDMAKGYAPTKEQLDTAMSRFKGPTAAQQAANAKPQSNN